MEEVQKAIGDDKTIIFDVRTLNEKTGLDLSAGAFRRGRIPDMVHINYTELFDDNGVKTISALKTLLESKGITKDKNIITYCQSGVRSAMAALVLTDVLGYQNVRNYDGSWIEWSYHKDLPIVNEMLNIVSAVILIIFSIIVLCYFKKRKPWLIKVGLLVLAIYAIFLLWNFNFHSMLSMDKVGELQNWINSFGIWGPLVFIGMFVVAAMFMLPGAPFGIVAGIVFGPIFGTIYVSIAATVGSALAFLAGRYVLRDYAEKLVAKTPSLKKIDDGVQKNGWRMLMITRIVPLFPYNVQNYVYGLTKINFLSYTFFSWLFMLPGTIAYVFIAGAATSGANLKTIMLYFSLGALVLVGLSFLPKYLTKKVNVDLESVK